MIWYNINVLYYIILYYIIVVFLQFHINMPNCLRPSVAHFWPIFDPCGDNAAATSLQDNLWNDLAAYLQPQALPIFEQWPADTFHWKMFDQQTSYWSVRDCAEKMRSNDCNANWLASDYWQHFWCNSVQLISRSNFK